MYIIDVVIMYFLYTYYVILWGKVNVKSQYSCQGFSKVVRASVAKVAFLASRTLLAALFAGFFCCGCGASLRNRSKKTLRRAQRGGFWKQEKQLLPRSHEQLLRSLDNYIDFLH